MLMELSTYAHRACHFGLLVKSICSFSILKGIQLKIIKLRPDIFMLIYGY